MDEGGLVTRDEGMRTINVFMYYQTVNNVTVIEICQQTKPLTDILRKQHSYRVTPFKNKFGHTLLGLPIA